MDDLYGLFHQVWNMMKWQVQVKKGSVSAW